MKKSIKIKIVFAVIIALVLFTGGILFMITRGINNVNEDRQTTLYIAGDARQIIQGDYVNHDTYEMGLEIWEPTTFRKFIYVEQDAFDANGQHFNYRYNPKINKMLNTDGYINEYHPDGIIVANYHPENVGEFPDGSTATQMNLSVFFIKLPEKIIVRHLILEGEEPPMTISKGRHGSTGKLPSEKEIVAAIKSELGFN